MTERTQKIYHILEEAFAPDHLELSDDSARHEGHEGAAPGGETHFSVVIVAHSFKGQTRLTRHRCVYEALQKAFQDHVHALSIRALTPEEYKNKYKIKL